VVKVRLLRNFGEAAVRKLLSFAVAVALFGGGIYLLVVHVLLADILYGKVFIVAGALIGFGGWWLWADFIGPALGIKVKE
jgi:hypothetical protein